MLAPDKLGSKKLNNEGVMLMIKKLSVLVVIFMCANLLFAHGPTRQKVSEKIIIESSPEEVWNVVKNFHDMSWHPAIAETTGEGGNEPGAARTLTLGNGAKIFEVLEKYNKDEMKFFYRIADVDVSVLPVTNYSSWLIVREAENDATEVEWKGAFYRGFPNNDPPPELSDEAAVEAITGVYKSGLEHLKKLCEGDA